MLRLNKIETKVSLIQPFLFIYIKIKIGLLYFQGGVIEHTKHINSLGDEVIEVKDKKDLDNIDAIILPGGESTTIGKLLDITGLLEPLRDKIKKDYLHGKLV